MMDKGLTYFVNLIVGSHMHHRIERCRYTDFRKKNKKASKYKNNKINTFLRKSNDEEILCDYGPEYVINFCIQFIDN